MAVYVGNNGGIYVSTAESTYGTAPALNGTNFDTLFGISSSLSLKKSLIEPTHLAINPIATTDYTASSVDGEISCHWCSESDVMSNLLLSFFNDLGSTYGMASTPGSNSVAVSVTHGSGLGYTFDGLKATSFGLEITPNEYPVMTMGFIGRNMTKVTSPLTAAPSVGHLNAAPSSLGPVTIDGTTIGVKSISISAERQYSGGDRVIVGGSYLSEPVEIGKRSITASFTVDLSDDTGLNSVSILDDFLTGDGDLGTVVIDTDGANTFTLSSCRMTGDTPSLGEGLIEYPINVTATALSFDEPT